MDAADVNTGDASPGDGTNGTTDVPRPPSRRVTGGSGSPFADLWRLQWAEEELFITRAKLRAAKILLQGRGTDKIEEISAAAERAYKPGYTW